MSEAELGNTQLADADSAGLEYKESERSGTQLDLVEYVERHIALAQDAGTETSTRMSVDLAGANLEGADLSNTDLSETIGLTQAQLDDAFGDDETVLPPGLTVKSR